MTRVSPHRALPAPAPLLLVVILTGASPPVVACPEAGQGQPAGPTALRLSVDDAVTLALQASPLLDRLGALQTAAEAEKRGAEAGRWPQVDVGGGYQRRSDVPELQIAQPSADPDVPGQLVTIYPNIPDNWQLRAGLTWPVYTGGQTGGRIEAATQGHLAAGYDREAARNDLVLDVKHTYWRLVSARQNVQVFAESMRAFEAHLEDARNLERFGMAASNDVLAVEVKRDRAELNRLEAEAAAEIAQADLRRLLDVPSHVRIEATEPLEVPP